MTSAGSPSVRAVLFDLDGVLVDSFEAWYAVVNEAAEVFGTPPVTREGLRALFGQGVEADAEILYPGHTPQEVGRVYDASMPRHVDRVVVGRESHAVLEDLGARGILRAVVTNTQASLAGRILERKALAPQLETWTASDGRLREKPHPDLLEEALRRLGVDPTHALMVGDSRYDEEAARAAGVGFVSFDLLAARGGSLAVALESALTRPP